jgi:hypothetical protein
MMSNSKTYSKDSGTPNTRLADVVILGNKHDLKRLLQDLKKIGIGDDRSWNEMVFRDFESGHYIMLAEPFDKATVFTNRSLMSVDAFKFSYTGYNLEVVLDNIRNHVESRPVPKHAPKLTVGGYEVTVCSKNLVTIAGYDFAKDFWDAALVVSKHSKAEIKIGCFRQYEIDTNTINKVLDLMSNFKKKK